MVFLSVPLAFVSFMFGGLSLSEVLLSYFVILITVLFYGFIGFFCSNLFKKTSFATITSIVIVFSLVLGSLILAFILDEFDHTTDEFAASVIMPLSPFPSMISVFNPDEFLSDIAAIWQLPIPMWVLNFGFSMLWLLILAFYLDKRFYKLHRK